MAHRDEILSYLDERLEVSKFKDYGPQGAQVLGKEEVQKVCTAVSCSEAVFAFACDQQADMVLTHHGMFWDNEPRQITPRLKRHLELLFGNEITVASYHLALDAHPEIGNNFLTLRALSYDHAVQPFTDLGWGGGRPHHVGIPIADFMLKIAVGSPPHAFLYGPPSVTRVAVVTGRGGRYLEQAAAEGYDLFYTGEAEEPSYELAQELGIHFVAAGHYVSEQIAIRHLGWELAEKFGVVAQFVPRANPV